jgi:hypothetical protein
MSQKKTGTAARSGDEPTTPPPSRGMLVALKALADAENAAKEHQLDAWAFAVSLGELHRLHASETDLRRLIAGKLIEHRYRSLHRGRRKEVVPSDHLELTSASRFVVTAAGRVYLDGVVLRPRWDLARRELWLGDVFIKRISRAATLVERILSAFEEDGWPPRIDDPLPRTYLAVPQQRLHNVVYKLNRSQSAIRFERDGTGEGVVWQVKAHFRGRAILGNKPADPTNNATPFSSN